MKQMCNLKTPNGISEGMPIRLTCGLRAILMTPRILRGITVHAHLTGYKAKRGGHSTHPDR